MKTAGIKEVAETYSVRYDQCKRSLSRKARKWFRWRNEQ